MLHKLHTHYHIVRPHLTPVDVHKNTHSFRDLLQSKSKKGSQPRSPRPAQRKESAANKTELHAPPETQPSGFDISGVSAPSQTTNFPPLRAPHQSNTHPNVVPSSLANPTNHHFHDIEPVSFDVAMALPSPPANQYLLSHHNHHDQQQHQHQPHYHNHEHPFSAPNQARGDAPAQPQQPLDVPFLLQALQRHDDNNGNQQSGTNNTTNNNSRDQGHMGHPTGRGFFHPFDDGTS